jgi:hypothetical protein
MWLRRRSCRSRWRSGKSSKRRARFTDNGEANLTVNANGPFTFTASVHSGGPYDVAVFAQPASPTAETCVVAGGTGTVGSANITSVTVTCETGTICTEAFTSYVSESNPYASAIPVLGWVMVGGGGGGGTAEGGAGGGSSAILNGGVLVAYAAGGNGGAPGPRGSTGPSADARSPSNPPGRGACRSGRASPAALPGLAGCTRPTDRPPPKYSRAIVSHRLLPRTPSASMRLDSVVRAIPSSRAACATTPPVCDNACLSTDCSRSSSLERSACSFCHVVPSAS